MNLQPEEISTDFMDALRAEADATREGHACVCKGKEYLPLANGLVKTCECGKRKAIHSALAKAGVPRGYFDLTLSRDWHLRQDADGNDLGPMAMDQKKIIGYFVAKYIKAFRIMAAGEMISIEPRKGVNIRTNSLLLMGSRRSGRTLLAAVIAKHVMLDQFSMRFFDWSVDIAPAVNDFDSREAMDELAYEFEHRDLIVIDGVFNDDVNSRALPRNLDRLARARLRVRKPTVITGDYSVLDMKAGEGWKSLLDQCYQISLPNGLSHK